MICLALILLAIGLLQSWEPQINSEATMPQISEAAVIESYEDVLEKAIFFVKARFVEQTDYLQGTSYQYTYELLEDYGGNIRPQDGNRFHVYSMTAGLYEPGETYYLFMQGTESYMAGTVMYTFVEDSFIVQFEKGIFTDKVQANLEVPSSAKEFEDQVCSYAQDEKIAEKTAEVFSSDAYLTLEDNVLSADAIWCIQILDKQEMNPNASSCKYRIEQVFRGNLETAPEGSVFTGMYPKAQVDEGNSYYVILKDTGDYEYRPFTFDHWLIPVGSEESLELMELLDENVGTSTANKG